jgi:uncharacterized membrane protein
MTLHRLWIVVLAITAACAERGGAPGDSAVREDTTRAATAATPVALPIRALGTEPFWAIDVDSAGLRFMTPDDQAGIPFPPVSPTVTGDTTVWVGKTERAEFEVRVWREQCSDGMSDRVYPYGARVRVDSTTYTGCADAKPAG